MHISTATKDIIKAIKKPSKQKATKRQNEKHSRQQHQEEEKQSLFRSFSCFIGETSSLDIAVISHRCHKAKQQLLPESTFLATWSCPVAGTLDLDMD
jgi:hypothetical protein